MAEIVAAQGSPLTGGKVLAMLLTFFVVVFSVNGLMMYDAVSTFRGQIEDHPYEAGLKYNSELAAAAAQEQRGWKVDVSLTDGVRATFRDAQGRALEGLTVSGAFMALADRKRDRAFALRETGPGVYTVETPAPAGVWEFEIIAKRGDEILFRSQNRITR